MFAALRALVRTPSAEEFRQRQLDDAKLKLEQFEVTLDYDMAMRDMFKARIACLSAEK